MKRRIFKIGALIMSIALLLCGLAACDVVDKAKGFVEEKKNMVVNFRDVTGHYTEEEIASLASILTCMFS